MARKKKQYDGYRSGFEKRVAESLTKKKGKFEYETVKLKFEQPAKRRSYTADFKLVPSGVLVECKGRLTAADRHKMVWVRDQNPGVDIRILLMRDQPIRKGSPTLYSDWCIKNKFEYCIGIDIPKRWITG